MHRIPDMNFKTILSSLAIFTFLLFQKTANAQIVGPTHVCTVSGAGYGIIDTCYNSYNWTVTPGIGVFFGPTNGFSVDVAWVNPGTAQLCVEVNDTCANMPQTFCVSVLVETIIIPPTNVEITLCEGECFSYFGDEYCAPGTYPIFWQNAMGCDSVVNLIITTLPNIFTNLGNVPLPCDGTLEVCDETFTAPGAYQVACTSWQGCDSTIVFNLLPGDVEAQLSPPDILTCANTEVVLDGSASSAGPEFTYAWTTTDGNFTGPTDQPQASVDAPGAYCLTVTNTSSGCEMTACTDVAEDTETPGFSIGGGVLPCNGGTTTLAANPWGFNFTYLWTGPGIVSGAMSLNPVVDQPGTYCLTMTDAANGCTSEQCVDVAATILVNPDGPEVVCEPGIYTYLLQFASAVPPPYDLTYQMNGVPQAPLVVNSNPYAFVAQVSGTTTFQFTASDQSGCTSLPAVITTNLDDFDIDFTVTQSGCEPVQVTAFVSGPFQNTASSFLWSNGSQDSMIQVVQPGWYSVTVEDNYGCGRADSVFVTPDFGGACAVVEGFVLQDELDNCTSDPGETGLAGWIVEAQGSASAFYGTTDADGYFFIPVDPGDYTVSVFPPSQFWEPCTNGIPVSAPNADDVATVNFLIQPVPGCPELTVDISTGFLRRCFSNNHYYVNYCNEGTGPATGAYVEISLDPFLNFVGSNQAVTDLGNNLLRFDLGDVGPGDCGTFWINVEVSCDAELGQTHCTEAHIFPDSSCVQPDPLWSGASIEIEADCTDSTRFILKNAGTGTMTVPLEYIVIEDAVMYRYDTEAPLAPGESVTVSLPANGSTWRITAEQEPLHPQPFQPVAFVEGCGVNPGGSFSLGFVGQFSPGDPQRYLDIDCTDNVGAYDPNDKTAAPTGYRDEHFIAQGTEIEYLIRFQNTGTDTAFNVVIRDTLSPHLDIASVRPGASSHAYDFEIYGEGILKFTFPNIQLPDSTTNLEASQGFVQFKFSPNDSLPVFTEIENSAAIYFDFNEPIITNTVFHTIEKPVVHSARDVTLCAGEPFNGAVFTSDTMLVDTFSFAQYDSMVWTQIEVLPALSAATQATICEGTSYTFGSQTLTQAGTYGEVFTAANGCDSTVTLTLAVVENFEVEISAQICEGETYDFDNQQLTSPGEYVANYLTAAGCDSTVTLTLGFLENFETELDAAICQGDSYTFNGESLTQPGTYTVNLAASNGCDSTVTLTLGFLENFETELSAAICQGDSYPFNGESLTQPGTYIANLAASNGCDSTVTLTLGFLENFETELSAAICQGDSYPFNGQTLTAPGTYTASLAAANGCDSTVTLTLDVVESFILEMNAEICDGESYEFDNQQLTEPGEYVANYLTAGGCDSTVTLTLAVLENAATNLAAEICEGESYLFSGEAFSEPGTYTAHFTAANSCDSTVTLDLAVLPNVADTLFVELEWGMSYNGIPVFSDTTIIENLTAANGCDSVVTAHITILTGIKNAFENAPGLRLFPNPASGAFFMKFHLKKPEKVSLRVIDVIGREVQFELRERQFGNGEHTLEIAAADWPGGVYLVHFQTNSGIWTEKLVLR